MKTIGILSQCPESDALLFLTCCKDGAGRLGPSMHPDIVMATATLGLCLPAYATGDFGLAVPHLEAVVDRLHKAGADFFVCAEHAAHGALALFADRAPIPCLHIADTIAAQIAAKGWRRAGVLGTRSTMTGTIYREAFRRVGVEKLIPEAKVHARLDQIMVQTITHDGWPEDLHADLIAEIVKLKERGADCVVMTSAERPLPVAPERSPLPMLDSVRILARAAVGLALGASPILSTDGWVRLSRP